MLLQHLFDLAAKVDRETLYPAQKAHVADIEIRPLPPPLGEDPVYVICAFFISHHSFFVRIETS